MAFTKEKHKKVENLMDQYIDDNRPPEAVRDQVDLGYAIDDDNQSIEIFEIRPALDNPDEKIREPAAKTTWVQRQKVWNVYWQQADMKWHGYEPVPQVDTLREFLELVEEDANACFWG